MKPDLDDLGDPTIDDRAGVDDDVRIADRRLVAGVGTRRSEEADGLGGHEEVLSLGDGQSDHAQAEEDRDAQRQELTEWIG